MHCKNIHKIDLLNTVEACFITEQIGIPENEFKENVVRLFQDQKRTLRAYLVQVKYGQTNDFNVALCISMASGKEGKLANDIASIFRRMFGTHEHLDILFLSNINEIELRKVCCPFLRREIIVLATLIFT
jgi:hypothetical protein